LRFYHAAFGEFELRGGRPEVAREHFSAALALSRNATERQFFNQRIEAYEPSLNHGLHLSRLTTRG
jgi:predicted RNA polymerase sigma factor